MANSIYYARVLFLNCINSYITKRSISTSSSLARLRSEWRKNRPPANTMLGVENITEIRKAYGGFKKWKAVTVKSGKYGLPSQNINSQELLIEDVVHSDTGLQARENKIITKHTYIIVDVKSLKDQINIEQLSSNSSQLTRAHIKELFDLGKLYAKVTSKPGQVGVCDGYIIEGVELDSLVNKLQNYQVSK